MAISPRYFFVINILIFQAGWFAAVLGGDLFATLFILPALVFHFVFTPSKKEDFIAVILCISLGMVHDSLLLSQNLLKIDQHLYFPPIWLILIWSLLGISLLHSLRWVYEKPLFSSLFGTIAAPISYLAGVKLSESQWTGSMTKIILVIAIIWLFLLPLHRLIFLRLKGYV